MEYLYFDTVVIGTGAAGYNAAGELKKLCDKSVCIVTEGVNTGTSRNTGSDKQTYYKLSLSGDNPDSVRKMAGDLFSGGSVDGDNALAEAALSSKCFYNLCSLGVPFPVNRYGEYVGYKTDHDPYMRATSAGPLTSRFMTEVLEKQAESLGIPVFDGLLAVEIITDNNTVKGLLCLDKANGEYKVFSCNNVILATGGPAGIYADTVYPEGHTGSTGLALKAGASLQNMTEWQYGLASVNPKWNVSGTYMQVLPRFVSVDENGTEREFLRDYFSDIYEALSFVFLKGYQWPFDSAKAEHGSSAIDLAVYNECVNNDRRVFLDYRKNPFGLESIDYEKLSGEAYTYLKNAEALFGTPIERLKKMNLPAVELYLGKGVDLEREMLEIALCAQHNNGGIAVNLWWQTSVTGLFAAGECAGTHGASRPGGSALNSGQAGSLRAAQFISRKKEEKTDREKFLSLAEKVLSYHLQLKERITGNENTAFTLLSSVRSNMSESAAAVRNIAEIKELTARRKRDIDIFPFLITAKDTEGHVDTYKYYDALLTSTAVLIAIEDYWQETAYTRGSAVYKNTDIEKKSVNPADRIQEISYKNGDFTVNWRSVRPIPENDGFFENVWRTYRENKNIY